MTAATPTSSGGTVVSWAVSPSLPAGLVLDTSTGEISGTPTAVTSSATYTVTATNTGGDATTTVTIVVNDVIPSSVSYSDSPFTLTKDSAHDGFYANIQRRDSRLLGSLSIAPSRSCFSTHRPVKFQVLHTAVTSSATYTITATNTGGRRYDHRDHRCQRHYSIFSFVQWQSVYLDERFLDDGIYTNLQRRNSHLLGS